MGSLIQRTPVLLLFASSWILGCERKPAEPRNEAPSSAAAPVIDTRWTEAAARRMNQLTGAGKVKYTLPEIRIYDGRRQLIFHQTGVDPANIGSTLDTALREKRLIPGPAYDGTVADLETSDGRPARGVMPRSGPATIFEYWASWCVPCGVLEKEVKGWVLRQPRGSVQIVRVEADLTKLQRAQGGKTYLLKKGPDGRLVKVEIN